MPGWFDFCVFDRSSIFEKKVSRETLIVLIVGFECLKNDYLFCWILFICCMKKISG